MRVLLASLLLLFLVGCGSGSDPVAPAPKKEVPANTGDLSDLDGKPIEEVVIALIPRLAETSPTSPDDLARSLDEKWTIRCESICRIERK